MHEIPWTITLARIGFGTQVAVIGYKAWGKNFTFENESFGNLEGGIK